jgi:hypothetical protein
MAAFYVTLTIVTGGYEKGTSTLVLNAPNKKEACKYALALECHGQSTFNDDGDEVSDLNGEFEYYVDDAVKIKDEHVPIFKSYMLSHTYDKKELEDLIDNLS